MLPNYNDPFASSSPLSGLLGQPPKTVSAPEPPPVDPEPLASHSDYPVYSPEEVRREPLTADEIRARAEVQARTYGALILLLNAVIECVKVSFTLKKGEYAYYLDLKKEYQSSGTLAFDGEIKDLFDRCEKFDETLKDLESDVELDDSESKLLFKAIKADLERKNKKNELDDDSVWGAIVKLILTRQMSSAFDLITTFTRRRAQR